MTLGSWMIRLLLVSSIVVFFFSLPCCAPSSDSSTLPNSPSQPPTTSGQASNSSNPIIPSPISTFPAVPAVLPKPIILGQVYPPVVSVAAITSEPYIRVLIVPEQAYPPSINPQLYRGKVLIERLADGEFIAVNALPIEEYLAGVLSRELYGDWRPTAYAAQAIAARTYALYQIMTFGRTHAWDVTGTLTSQMYGGKEAETVRSWDAVTGTRGLVLYTSGDSGIGIFCSFYCSCDGGATQSAADAWGDAAVVTLTDESTGTLDDESPDFFWPPMVISKAQITQVINWWGLKNRLPYLTELGPIASVAVSEKNTITGRPQIITLRDVYGHVGKMRAEEFRMAIFMNPFQNAPVPPSSFFDIRDAGSYIELTNGRGHGHGVGMSQWGDEAMALHGMTYQQILSFYYPSSWIHEQW